MEIFNFGKIDINFNLIINISIGIIMGISLSNIFSDIISKVILKITPNLFNFLVKKLFLSFDVFVIKKDDSIFQKEFSKIYNIIFSKGIICGVTAFGVNIRIKSKKPFLTKFLKKTVVKVVVVNTDNKIEILQARLLPGMPCRYQIREFEFDANTNFHCNLTFRVKEKIRNYKIPVWIYYDEEKFEDNIWLNSVNEK